MDPNLTLLVLRTALKRWDELNSVYPDPDDREAVEEITDALLDTAQALHSAAEALDGWLTARGTLPDAWNRPGVKLLPTTR